MMQPGTLTGILIAAIAAWIFGAIYYTALGSFWLAAQGKTSEQAKAEFAGKSTLAKALPFALSFVGAFIMGLVLYGIMIHSGMFSARAGAISGVVRSRTGRVLVVKGDTHKEKTLQTEYTERDDGSVAETRILTDKFVPVIRAWDMTPGSATRGEVLTIR